MHLLQQLTVIDVAVEDAHLVDDDLVEFDEAFGLWDTLVDEVGVEALHIRQADQFVEVIPL